MRQPLAVGLVAYAALAIAETVAPPPPQSPAAQGARVQGAKVTFERLGVDDAAPPRQTQHARLLSLAVERGESASPFLSPGLFRASYVATLQLPARDRCRFRLDGRGTVKLAINGEVVLDGAMRPGKPLETADAVRLKKGDNELAVTFESGAMGDGQFRLFWSGSDFGFEPIAPERLLRAADDADVRAGEERRAGLHLFAERRCARCHEYETLRVGESAFSELDGGGPDLRTAGSRLQAGWIAAWLREPRRFRPDATMPEFALTDAECDDLAAWLAGLGAPLTPPQLPADAKEKGKQLFRRLGCVACHVEPGAAADPALPGRIDLAFVPAKWHAAALIEYLHEPTRFHPHVRMPDLRVSVDDAALLAGFVLGGAAEPLPAPVGDAARGKRLAQKHACALCHTLDVELADRPWPRWRTCKPERGCLGEGEARGSAPDHGLSPSQRASLRAFMPFAEDAPFRRSPVDFVQRHLAGDRCIACHALDGAPSQWARWAEHENTKAPLPKEHDPVAQGVPALTWVGSKLQPSWIERFVIGQEKSPRPWLSARMPVFARHGVALAQGLVREHGYGAQDEPPTLPDATLAMHGDRLLAQGTGFGCVTCHALGDQPATQVFEREGVELLTARRRLRHEFFARWLRDPRRLDPDSRMPQFAPGGKTAYTDVLGGDGEKQFEAIWQHLGTRSAPR